MRDRFCTRWLWFSDRSQGGKQALAGMAFSIMASISLIYGTFVAIFDLWRGLFGGPLRVVVVLLCSCGVGKSLIKCGKHKRNEQNDVRMTST